MSKVFSVIVAILFNIFIFASTTSVAFALPNCNGITHDPTPILNNSPQAKFTINVGDNTAFDAWKMEFKCGTLNQKVDANKEGSNSISATINNSGKLLVSACEFDPGKHEILVKTIVNGQEVDQCLISYTVASAASLCQLSIDPSTNLTSNSVIKVSGTNLRKDGRFALFIDDNTRITGNALDPGLVSTPDFSGIVIPSQYLTPVTHRIDLRSWVEGSIVAPAPAPGHKYSSQHLCPLEFTIGTVDRPGGITRGDQPGGIFRPTSALGEQCGTDTDPAIKTAIGCIHTSPVGFIKDALKFILGIAGGLAFLMMLLGAFQMLTSAGNPETLNAGKDRLTSAVIGLLFVIFSVLLLQIIGVDILGLPQFER